MLSLYSRNSLSRVRYVRLKIYSKSTFIQRFCSDSKKSDTTDNTSINTNINTNVNTNIQTNSKIDSDLKSKPVNKSLSHRILHFLGFGKDTSIEPAVIIVGTASADTSIISPNTSGISPGTPVISQDSPITPVISQDTSGTPGISPNTSGVSSATPIQPISFTSPPPPELSTTPTASSSLVTPNVPPAAPVEAETGTLQKPKTEKKWPPPPDAWPIKWIVISGIWVICFLYAQFAARDRTLEDLAETIRWGGEMDQLHAFRKLNTYLNMEVLGIKISYKLLQIGVVDEILGVLATPRSKKVKEEAARLLCKLTANNSEICSVLLRDGALDVLRNHVSADNIHVLYTIANLSSQKLGVVKIVNDTNLLDSLVYTMAYSMKTHQIQDRYVQRALLRTFSNLVNNESVTMPSTFLEQLDNILLKFNLQIMFDVFSMVHYMNILPKISGNSSHLRAAFPILQQIPQQQIDTKHNKEEYWSLGIGAGLVGVTSILFAYLYQRFFFLKDRYPLSLYQRKWARSQIRRAPLFAMAYFLIHHGLVYFDKYASDYVSFHPDDGRDPETDWFGGIAWQEKNSNAQSTLMAVHLLRLPVYYIGLRYSFYSLIPSLLPWKIDSTTPPDWLLNFLPVLHYIEHYLFHPPSNDEPTPEQIEDMLKGKSEYDAIFQNFMTQNK